MIMLWIMVGLLVGYFSVLLSSAKTGHDALITLLIGCISALFGGFFSVAVTSFTLGEFSIVGIACALVSASIFLFGYHEMQAA